MRPPILLTALLACLLLALPVAPALANASDDRIVADCNNSPTGALTGRYTREQLRQALRSLPGDSFGYSGCFDAIRAAIFARGGGNRTDTSAGDDGFDGGTRGDRGDATPVGTGNPAGGGDATEASGTIPSTQPPAAADRPVAVAGTALTPGVLPDVADRTRGLPTALLVLLALLSLAALIAAVLTIGRRVAVTRGS